MQCDEKEAIKASEPLNGTEREKRREEIIELLSPVRVRSPLSSEGQPAPPLCVSLNFAQMRLRRREEEEKEEGEEGCTLHSCELPQFDLRTAVVGRRMFTQKED